MNETITWCRPAERMPDDDETVLLKVDDESQPVWPGYHDGDDGWRMADGMPIEAAVLAWARMPEGPA